MLLNFKFTTTCLSTSWRRKGLGFVGVNYKEKVSSCKVMILIKELNIPLACCIALNGILFKEVGFSLRT